MNENLHTPALPRNILIIKLGSLGDVVMAEGAMHDIRLHHPEAKITVMTTPPYKKMLERCPWVDEVIIDPRDPRYRLNKMLELRKRLREYNFDFVYDLQRAGRTKFYYNWFWFRSIPWFGKVRGCSHYIKPIPGLAAMDSTASALENIGVETEYALKNDVRWMADDVHDILRAYDLTPQNYIVLIPGCSAEHPQKRWPYYPELARQLLDLDQWVVTAPGPDEMELCSSIPGEMLLYQDKYLDYFKLAGILLQATYIVGNDTGPTHIGAHMRKPGLALFSDHTAPTRTGIQHTLFKWLEAPSLKNLSVDLVLETVMANLKIV